MAERVRHAAARLLIQFEQAWRKCRVPCGGVKADALAAGFKLDAESSILANKSDDHTNNVFDPSVRGHTDQFLFRFKKPK